MEQLLKQQLHQRVKWCLMVVLALCVSLPTSAQGTLKERLSFECTNESLASAFRKLEQASGYKILFTYEDVQSYRATVSVKDSPVSDIMDALIAGHPLTYRLEGSYITVVPARQTGSTGAARSATGKVSDVGGNPIPGVSVVSDDGSLKGITSADGTFAINLPAGKDVRSFAFSFIGMKSKTVAFKGRPLSVTLEEDAQTVDEVVVTGIFERKKEGFTGSANRMTGDEIRNLSSGNILNAITMLDPGFRMGDNMLSGSNPSSVPDFTMRGQSSMGDYSTDETVIMRGDIDTRPNQPLFVLDGIIDVGVTKIMDLDPAQIESVTLLKDAAAMAIYGSQASNGVVVVETKAPEAGRLRVTYNGNYKVEYPDLTDYHLLNAAEKLELERRAGYYDESGTITNVENRYDVYRRKFLEVQRGVDTYWLSQPLETVFAHRHGINLEGGTQELRYKIYAGLNDAPGIMRGTGVNGKSVSVDIRYRYKGLLISNIAYVDYTTSDRTSPYGTFDQYARLNPYYRIRDEHGQIQQYLEQAVYDESGINSAGMTVGNPMYNTLYNSIDRNVAFEVRDAFRAEYSPLQNLRLAMDLTVTKTTSDTDIFKSANHTDFIEVTDLEERGSYRWTNATSLDWDLAFTASYNKVWQNRHVLATFFRYNIKETKDHSAGAYATGFPNDNMDEVFLGAKVQQNEGSENTTRSFGGVATLSYTYDQKYAVDVNGRMDASSEFGRNNRYAPFWSAGLRWNADKESWIHRLGFVDELVLRATYGVTGEQGFQAYQALQMYNYSNSMRIYQSSDVVGTLLYGMGNPDLKWQTTDSWNVGLDFTLFNNRLSGRFEYYYKLTENTVLDYSLAPSIGFNTIKDNVGNISNEGYEFTLRWMPYYNVAQQMNLSFVVNGSHNKNTIKKISNALRARNEEQMQEDPDNPNKLSRPLPRYEEGYSQSMIWAVRSLGIDPITGREIFLTRDGERTSEWNAADQVPVGDTEPDLQGTMSLNFNWKGLSVNVAAQYRYGGQYYNKTLVDKVENADLRYNVDRRAYTDRWQNVGDLAVFKAVTQDVNGSQTKASTRFLMDQNELVLNTINIQYRFEQRYTPWIKRLGLSSASVGLYMEDLFHWSTIRQERGIEYPMSRQISMSLNLTF